MARKISAVVGEFEAFTFSLNTHFPRKVDGRDLKVVGILTGLKALNENPVWGLQPFEVALNVCFVL